MVGLRVGMGHHIPERRPGDGALVFTGASPELIEGTLDPRVIDRQVLSSRRLVQIVVGHGRRHFRPSRSMS